jgi:penicillin amidase
MKRVLLAAFVLAVAIPAISFAQPEAHDLVLSGLKSEVTVRRDGRGIPYIEARNDADLYFAQGYITATDRLWQMDLMRRLSRGETAEIFGATTLEEDKRWRRFGFSAIADESLKELTPQLRSALENYARGVNAYISSLDDKTLPVEFRILQYKPREWKPSDTLVIGKILADALSTTWRNDLLRMQLRKTLSPEKFADVTSQVTPYDVVLFGKDNYTSKPNAAAREVDVSPSLLAAAEKDEELRAASLGRVGLYAEDLAASNNWVISGKRTADGKPILANDPHLAPTAPGIWYLTHLTSPGMRVSGVTFPGVPGIVLGHNEFIAWGATNVGPDVQDLYEETFNATDEYKTPTGWAKSMHRTETINVRQNVLKTETKPSVIDVIETSHGPIVADEGGKKYSLKWTAFDPKNNEFEAFFAMNRAKNWTEFQNALKTYGGATQNFVYADVKGNIGWYAAGRIPLRRQGDGAFTYDGSTTDGDWVGYIPFNELPHLFNPPSGLIVTANQRIVGTDYKYPQIGRDVAPPFRARMIYDDIVKKQKLTMDDVRDIQYEDYNIPLAELSKYILAGQDLVRPELLDLLKVWDGRMTADSRAALQINEIRNCMADEIASANKPVPMFVIRDRVLLPALKRGDTSWLPPYVRSWDNLIQGCYATSWINLTKRLGSFTKPGNWTWGNEFKSRFPHPLAAAPLIGMQFSTPSVPLNGSGQTPNVGSSVSMRHIASPGNWDATRHVIPLGQSGNPQSPYFKDQFEAWRTGTPMIFPFSKPAVETAAREVWTLSPR